MKKKIACRRKKDRASGIKSWPREDRPREKLFREGEHRLSSAELLAILLRSGNRGESALDLARKILLKFGTFRALSHTDSRQWRGFKGLGMAKLAQIRAALEIGRRLGEEEVREDGEKIKSSADAARLLMPRLRDLKKEIFKVILLDSKNRVLDVSEVEEGTVNQANPIIREVFQRALQQFSAAVICVHNHPSGEPEPSPEDREFTRKLAEAGGVLQIKVLDHVIIGDNRYYSFADHGGL